MAKIDNIYIGGSEGFEESKKTYNSGISFDLSFPSKISNVYFLKDDNWEIEVKEGLSLIIARTKENLSPEEILERGYLVCQKFLDLMSVTKIMNNEIKSTANSYIILYKEKNDYVLRIISKSQLLSRVSASMTIIRDGKEIPIPKKQDPKWISAFRYYRLSRMSKNLYEAYSNLFLATEALLSEIVPLNPGEKDKYWLKRALNEIKAKINFSSCVPKNTPDPIDYFYSNLYDLRCHLSHAKVNRCILPFSEINISKIIENYEYLHKLWNEITNLYYNLPKKDGSITNFGFKDGLNELLKEGFEILALDDPNKPEISDKKANPQNYPELKLPNTILDNTTLEDSISVKGSSNGEDLKRFSHLYKFCLSSKGRLLMFSFHENGMTLEGINKLECCFSIQLKNNHLP